MIAEYFEHCEEAEWAIESCLKPKYNFKDKGVCVNMCIGPEGDLHGNSCEEWKSITFYFPCCHRDMQPPFERGRVMRTCHSIVSTQLWTKGTPRKDKF